MSSRRAATATRDDQGAHPQTVEDHNRLVRPLTPLTWGFPRALTVLDGTEFHG